MELSFKCYEGDVFGNVYFHLITEKYYNCDLPKFSSSVVFSCNGQMIKQDFVMQINSRGKSFAVHKNETDCKCEFAKV